VALLGLALMTLLWASRAHWPLVQRLDGAWLDAQVLLRGPLTPGTEHPVALIAIDDASLAELDAPAARRADLARLIDRLRDAGARAVALDLLLLESGPPDDDAELARALREAEAAGLTVLLPLALPAGPPPTQPAASAPTTARADPDLAVLAQAYPRVLAPDERAAALPVQPGALLAPWPAFQAHAGMGHVTALRQTDGALRYDLPGLPWQGEWYPTLALRLAGAARGLPWSEAQLQLGHRAGWAEMAAPLDALSRQWVNYYGPVGRFPTHRFSDVLAGRVDAAQLRGRSLVVGLTALGTGDVFQTPFDAGLPGMERLATVADNLLTQRSLRQPWWAPVVEWGAMAALLLAAVALLPAWPTLRAGSGLFAAGVAWVLGSQWALVQHGWVLAAAWPVLGLGAGSALGLAWRSHQERLRKQRAQEALRVSEERYALAARGAADGLWDWSLDEQRVYFSERWWALMGLEPDPQAGMEAFTRPLDANGRAAFEAALSEHLAGRSQQLHHTLQFRQGEQERALLVRGMALRDAPAELGVGGGQEAGQGVGLGMGSEKGGAPSSAAAWPRVRRVAGSLTDLSETLALQRQLVHDAFHDRLTGLSNRAMLREQLIQSASPHLGLVLLGLDDFRALNDSHGSVAGDDVLRAVARRLSDLPGLRGSPARVGPDVFAALFEAPLSPSGQDEHRTPDAVAAVLREPLTRRGLLVSGTVGWAHRGQGVGPGDELLSSAELALALGKQRQRGQVRAFDPADLLLESSRRWLHDALDVALAQGQFQLFYQPLVRLSDRRLLGFEALIRWQHPERGFILPGDFIPYAEESGQVVPMGRWVLMEAADQLQRWQALGFDGEIAVNLSSRQFVEGDLAADVRAALARMPDVRPNRLKLEVTESMAMANPAQTAEALQGLAALGCKISIDDFGTGYSSLAYLHQFPFDTLKIDRSFVMRLHQGRDAVEIVRTIVGLAHALDKQALAEGVETDAQATLLAELGVHIGQGWLFGKPLPVAQAEAAIQNALAMA
jgi:diguanylate cyclase (GGDEF)-like protein